MNSQTTIDMKTEKNPSVITESTNQVIKDSIEMAYNMGKIQGEHDAKMKILRLFGEHYPSKSIMDILEML